MTGDHINKYLANGTLPILFEIGRIAMPIFVIVLAFNLARPKQHGNELYKKIFSRMIFFGSIASIPYIALNGVSDSWFPLNIFFTLIILASTIYFVEQGYSATALIVCFVGGFFVEYWWPALILGLSAWSYSKKPSIEAAVVAIVSCVALGLINKNMWALAVFPLLMAANKIDFKIPRCRWVFYGFYPLHLGVIYIIRIQMSKAGYLFF